MKRRISSWMMPGLKDERGQMVPWLLLLSGVLIGVAGLTIDLGHAYICHRELLASTDAAALAGLSHGCGQKLLLSYQRSKRCIRSAKCQHRNQFRMRDGFCHGAGTVRGLWHGV